MNLNVTYAPALSMYAVNPPIMMLPNVRSRIQQINTMSTLLAPYHPQQQSRPTLPHVTIFGSEPREPSLSMFIYCVHSM